MLEGTFQRDSPWIEGWNRFSKTGEKGPLNSSYTGETRSTVPTKPNQTKPIVRYWRFSKPTRIAYKQSHHHHKEVCQGVRSWSFSVPAHFCHGRYIIHPSPSGVWIYLVIDTLQNLLGLLNFLFRLQLGLFVLLLLGLQLADGGLLLDDDILLVTKTSSFSRLSDRT